MEDIRKETCLIVQKDGEYLVGWNCFYRRFNWSQSKYDAWRTRDRKIAEAVARKCGGSMMLFNPVVGCIENLSSNG